MSVPGAGSRAECVEMTSVGGVRLPWWRRVVPDPFLMLLLAAAAFALLLPCSGDVGRGLRLLANALIVLLFFGYGLRLAPSVVAAGLSDWRLQSAVIACTFVVFPLGGWLLYRLVPALLPDSLWMGVLFLCFLPSTVQSAVSFTSMAQGNTAAAVCAATLSNLLGVFLTPLLVALVLTSRDGGIGAAQVIRIATQLVLPFVAGQLLRPKLAAWAHRHGGLLRASDRSAILLSIYTAFSAATVQGLWTQIPARQLWLLVAVCAVLMTVVMAAAVLGSRALGLSRENGVVVLFCGSHKSLATGIPTANVLFGGAALGPLLLPLMIYHQLELMVGASLAGRYAIRQAPLTPDGDDRGVNPP